MQVVEALIARLQEKVPDLSNRVSGALQIAELMRQNALPQHTPAANVISVGLQGGAPDIASGLYRQMYDEVFGVLLTFRNNDQVGKAALARVGEVIHAVLNAVAGWAPENALGTFRLVRGTVVTVSAGTLVYQIDFALTDQLRIAT